MVTSKDENDGIYRAVSLDPWIWANQARSLKTSAQLSYDELVKISNKVAPAGERSDDLITFMQSYLLLSGYALENIIKGLVIARLPKGTKELDETLAKKIFNHNVIDLVPSDVKLNPAETELLTRLQVFAMWAGRYPIPKKTGQYYSAISVKLLRLEATDYALIDSLFFKFDKLIIAENRD